MKRLPPILLSLLLITTCGKESIQKSYCDYYCSTPVGVIIKPDNDETRYNMVAALKYHSFNTGEMALLFGEFSTWEPFTDDLLCKDSDIIVAFAMPIGMTASFSMAAIHDNPDTDIKTLRYYEDIEHTFTGQYIVTIRLGNLSYDNGVCSLNYNQNWELNY